MRTVLLACVLLLAGCAGTRLSTTPAQAGPAQLGPAQLPTSAGLTGRSSSSSPATGLVIPLYVDPGSRWDEVIDAKQEYPSVPMALIVNVDNGPGPSRRARFAQYIEKAQKAGIWVLGYVYSSYGKRPIAQVESDIDAWYTSYYTDGVFIDQMKPHAPKYYSLLTQAAHNDNLWLVMGNPGVSVRGSEGPDVINFYERKGYPSLSFLQRPGHLLFDKSRWSFIAGAVPFDANAIKAALPYVGYLYATDAKEPECYCKLPTYFQQLVATLASND